GPSPSSLSKQGRRVGRGRHSAAPFLYPAPVFRRPLASLAGKPKVRGHRLKLVLAALAPLTMLLVLAAAAVGALADEPSAEEHDGQVPFGDASAHEAAQGFPLAANEAETVTAGLGCVPDAPVRAYQIVAINVEMTLNRFLDYDPQGRMYILEEDLGRVRAEEA